jgi:hypothetical protein
MAALFAALLVGGTLGCGSSKPEMVDVSGTVTLDGKPLPDGYIVFVADDGYPMADPGTIANGYYSLQARPGTKKVQIRATKIIPGGARGAYGEPYPEDYLPKRYNYETTLTAHLESGKANTVDFELTSKLGTARPTR